MTFHIQYRDRQFLCLVCDSGRIEGERAPIPRLIYKINVHKILNIDYILTASDVTRCNTVKNCNTCFLFFVLLTR